MCGMKRRTAGFLDAEDDLLVAYSTEGTPGREALQQVVPEVPVDSVSSAIRALVIAGHRSLAVDQLRQSYDAAVAAGDVDEEAASWYRGAATTLAEIWDAG